MPSYLREDQKPVVHFDPTLEISPFILFRRLRNGQELHLIDVRAEPGTLTLEGAEPYPGDGWEPPEGTVVLFDQNGSEAIPIAQRLLAEGYEEVRVLFGGLDLYEFSLDPQVVGEETYLIRSEEAGA